MSCCSQESYVPCGCKAHLDSRDPRAEVWMKVLGCLEFPLQNPVSHQHNAYGEAHPSMFLRGDWLALSLDQQRILAEEMERKFKVDSAIFKQQMRALGFVPIKDVRITVSCCQLHSRMLMSP